MLMEIAKHWKTILNTLQDGLMVLDPSGTILFMNPAAEKLTGYAADELTGKSCRILDCTGCDIIGKGPAENWCGLYARGDVRAKKCLMTNRDRRTVNIIKNPTAVTIPISARAYLTLPLKTPPMRQV